MDILMCLSSISIMQISLPVILGIVVMSFACEYMDSSLGMGYGTTLTPVLLLMKFQPLQIIPAVLISELFTGLLAGILHHRHGNVDFMPKMIRFPEIARSLSTLGYIETLKQGLPLHLKIAVLLAFCSIGGTVVAVFVAVNISKFWLKLYIGSLVLAMGITIIICLKRNFTFSWKKVISLGLIASFNKGMSGGGYGPVVTGGQILSGLNSRNAVAITSLAEGLTCLVGVIAYALVAQNPLDWILAPWLCIGSLGSVPFSTFTVKKINTKTLKCMIGVLTIILGLVTIAKTLL
jgi:uncharacterized membrane protein YfcA